MLKAEIGRARPEEVVAFGGHRLFTPPFQLSNQCAENCSFTSGEAALVAALAIPIVVVLWRNFGPVGRMRALVLAAGYVVLGAGLRVAMGRHFFSDALLSVLFSALIALVLYRVLDIATARRRFHLEAVPEDMVRIYRSLRIAAGKGWLLARPFVAQSGIWLQRTLGVSVLAKGHADTRMATTLRDASEDEMAKPPADPRARNSLPVESDDAF